ncbi:retrovirus-related pol polyprotein from transposon TNT 1-94 [Tanacetum coccineum]
MDNSKSVSVPLGAHFKVSLKDYPSSDWDVERMSKVPYANVVGSLIYLMVCTRPDIAYAVSIVSRYLANPSKNHYEVVKWILKYLKGTADVGLVYGRDQGKYVYVDDFMDADYAKDPDKGRSITGYMAEYMALTGAVKEIIWLKGLLIELGVNLRSVVVNCDNQSAIHLSRNATFHERMKHINMRYHFIREIVESKEIEVAKIGTTDNAADAFTKVVPGITPVTIIDRQLPFEYTIASRSTDVMVWNAVYDAPNEVACLTLGSMTYELQRQFENSSPDEMLQELKSMFEKQAEDLSVGLIINGLTSDFAGFVRKYNKHNIGKTIGELHALLIEYEKGLPKKAAKPHVMAIQGGRIQKANKKSLNAKGKVKGIGKGIDKSYILKPENPKSYVKEHPTKDDTCHHCKEVGHWKRNCHVYLAELIKKKK